MKPFLAILAPLVLLSSVAFAHPASKIDFTYDQKTKELKASIKHSVKDPAKHYIEKITILIDSKEFKKEEVKKQTNEKEEIYTIALLDAKAGAKIRLTTECNKGGKLAAEFVVP